MANRVEPDEMAKVSVLVYRAERLSQGFRVAVVDILREVSGRVIFS